MVAHSRDGFRELIRSSATVLGLPVLFLLVVGLTADPFGLFWPSRQTHRAGIWWHPRLALPVIADWRRPRIVVLGSSRVRDGFDPTLFGERSSDVMVFGVSGLLIEEQRAYAEQIARLRPEVVLIGFDLFAFNPTERVRSDFDREAMRDWALVRRAANLFASREALHAVWLSATEAAVVLPSGFHRRPPSPDPLASIAYSVQGFHTAPTLYGRLEGYEERLEDARFALRALRASGSRVVAFVNPEHADMRRRFVERGLGDLAGRFAEQIAQIADEEGVPFYDFSADPTLTDPPPERAGLHFFDGSHYTPLVAGRMLARFGLNR